MAPSLRVIQNDGHIQIRSQIKVPVSSRCGKVERAVEMIIIWGHLTRTKSAGLVITPLSVGIGKA